MKDLKAGDKRLTFNVASVSIKTKAGRFLTGKVVSLLQKRYVLRSNLLGSIKPISKSQCLVTFTELGNTITLSQCFVR